MKKANDKIAKGTPADRVYAVAVDENVKAQVAAAAEAEKPDTHVYKVPVGASPVLGAKDAPVTIIEFSDFQCPYCKHVEDTLKEVRAKYGKDVRFAWKLAHRSALPFSIASQSTQTSQRAVS